MKRARKTEHTGTTRNVDAPLLWDAQGRVLQWGRVKAWPPKNPEGKIPLRFTEGFGGRVLLWAYTMPPRAPEFVAWDSLTPKQRLRWDDAHYGEHLTRQHEEDRFYLGQIADEDEDARLLVSLVDSRRKMETDVEGIADAWGNPPNPTNGKRTPEEMRESNRELKTELYTVLGEWLYECVEQRSAKPLESMAKIIKLGKDMCLDSGWQSWHDQGVWHEVETFKGTVFRCWLLLSRGLGGLPTKRASREYVLQEWEAMGNSATTVETEFSGALKKLWLHGLPNGSSRPKSSERKRMQK
ncbi:MAG: hypothetical protein ACOYMN_13390 [Roseimicrobium sp.]